MKFSIVLPAIFIFLTLNSCNQAKKESGQSQQIPALPQIPKETVVSVNPVQPVNSETTEQPTTTQGNTAVRLNPPHGQPYHRCDIPVGAPLTSQPATATQSSPNIQIQSEASQNPQTATIISNNPTAPTIENARRMNPSQTLNTVPANMGAKPRLNPPHGQPWHRCEIAVGSPLP